jgi:hypothetical protein
MTPTVIANGKAIYRYANGMLGATCFTCEYTTVPRMLNRRLTANASKVRSAVMSRTRSGIPIHRGRPEVVPGMLLGYTKARASCTVRGAAVRYNETYVASRLGDHP